MKTINDLDEIEGISTSDWLPVWDKSNGMTRKVGLDAIVDLANELLAEGQPVWEYVNLEVDSADGVISYSFGQTRNNVVLYVSDVSTTPGTSPEISVKTPRNPVDGQEVCITFDCQNEDPLLIGFVDSDLTGPTDVFDTHRIFLDFGLSDETYVPYLHLKYNRRDSKWWKISGVQYTAIG